jgi:hypothetical protein
MIPLPTCCIHILVIFDPSIVDAIISETQAQSDEIFQERLFYFLN